MGQPNTLIVEQRLEAEKLDVTSSAKYRDAGGDYTGELGSPCAAADQDHLRPLPTVSP
ncbi:MAG: hypothetical protein DK306_001152 [Chloroflexi bacterium]|nr:MAG: hypothetical protein DK306_001152 [Chloroflexota bacterium]